MTSDSPIHPHVVIDEEFRASAVRRLRETSAMLSELLCTLRRSGFIGYDVYQEYFRTLLPNDHSLKVAGDNEVERYRRYMSGLYPGAASGEACELDSLEWRGEPSAAEFGGPRASLVPQGNVDFERISALSTSFSARIRTSLCEAADSVRSEVDVFGDARQRASRVGLVCAGFESAGIALPLNRKVGVRQIIPAVELDRERVLGAYFADARGFLSTASSSSGSVRLDLRLAIFPACVLDPSCGPRYVTCWRDRVAFPIELFLDGFRFVERCDNSAELYVVSRWYGEIARWLSRAWNACLAS